MADRKAGLPWDARPGAWTAGALALALVLGTAAHVLSWAMLDPAFHEDFIRYFYMAESFLDLDWDHALQYHYPPLFSIYLAAFALFAENSDQAETAGRLACLVLALLAAFPVYFLSLKVYNRTVAIMAAVMVTIKFSQPFYSPLQCDAEALLILLVYAALIVGLYALERESPLLSAAAGALFGLATLAKMEGQAFSFFWFFLLLVHLVWKKVAWRKSLAMAAVWWVFYVGVQTPYLGAYYRDTGVVSLNPKIGILYFSHNARDWYKDAYGLRKDDKGLYTNFQRVVAEGDHNPARVSAGGYFLDNIGNMIRMYVSRVGETFKDVVPEYLKALMPAGALLGGLVALAGFFRRDWTRDQARREAYLVSFGLMTLFSVPLFNPWSRYFAPMIPIWVMLFARGLERLSLLGGVILDKKLSPTSAGRARLALVAGLLFLSVLPDFILPFKMEPDRRYREIAEDRKVVARWLGRHLTPGKKIMSRWSVAPFWYLIGGHPEMDVFVPANDLAGVVAYARQEDVQFLIIEGGDFLARNPDLVPLFSSSFKSPDLVMADVIKGPNKKDYVIYLVRPGPYEDYEPPPLTPF